MPYRIVVVPKAQADLDQMIAWVAQRSLVGAARLLDRFHAELSKLSDCPESFGLAPENAHMNRDVRQFLFRTRSGSTYRALFDIHEETVRFLRIRGPGQDLITLTEIE